MITRWISNHISRIMVHKACEQLQCFAKSGGYSCNEIKRVLWNGEIASWIKLDIICTHAPGWFKTWHKLTSVTRKAIRLLFSQYITQKRLQWPPFHCVHCFPYSDTVRHHHNWTVFPNIPKLDSHRTVRKASCLVNSVIRTSSVSTAWATDMTTNSSFKYCQTVNLNQQIRWGYCCAYFVCIL